jgi:putative ABC transport system substrate-binding protein
MRRRDFISLLGGAAAWPLAARAQERDRMRRVGILMGLPEGDAEGRARLVAVRQVLQEAGWREGHNLLIDERWAGGEEERVKAFAKELVELQPDVIIAHSTPVLTALMQNTNMISIVFVQVSDPVSLGFVQSFAKPGANITGFTNYEYSTITGKWLELLKEIIPSITRCGLIFNPDTTPYHILAAFNDAAPPFAVTPLPLRDADKIESTIDAFARQPNSGLIVVPDIFTGTHRKLITELAVRYRLPTIYPFRFFATAGGLVSYGIEPRDLYRRAASYVNRILKGEKPADLPVQTPTKYELVVNLRTAKAIGLTIPESFLVRADEVIE